MSKPFKLAVKGVILDQEQRCLLIRRSSVNRNFVGKWEWPGGKADPGEAFTTVAIRETREETGLEIEITGVAGAMCFEMPSAHIVLLCLEARRLGGEIQLSEEHDDFAWVPLGELSRYEIASSVGGFMLDYARRKGTTP